MVATTDPRGSSRRTHVHLLGDSLSVAMRSESFGQVNGRPVQLHNHSVGGRGLRHFAHQYLPGIVEAVRANPGPVVLALGANDGHWVRRDGSVNPQYARWLRTIITQVREAGATGVTIMAPPGYNLRTGRYAGDRHSQMAALTRVYQEVARETGVNFVPPENFAEALSRVRSGDGLHFNDRSRAFATAMTTGLNQAGRGPGRMFADASNTTTRREDGPNRDDQQGAGSASQFLLG